MYISTVTVTVTVVHCKLIDTVAEEEVYLVLIAQYCPSVNRLMSLLWHIVSRRVLVTSYTPPL
jgi:hypothetical protein